MRATQSSTTPPLVEPELGIWFDGRGYHYQQYRYDRLKDAVAYAKWTGQARFPCRAPARHWEEWRRPDAAETTRMTAFDITYEHGRYCYGPFRYDFLDNALDYARRTLVPSAPR